MPHLAAAAIRSWLSTDTEFAAKSFQLLPAQVPFLTNQLDNDATGMHYSALISFVDSINGIRSGHFSWAIVQLYYVCFYAARILLAANSTALFYVGGARRGRPFSLVVETGNVPHREKGVTHEIVWKVMERELPNHALLGQIGLDKAFEWMKTLREDVNYRNPRFEDPLVPSYFGELSRWGLRAATEAYTNEPMLYAFDPDHAALAFPIACLRLAALAIRRVGGLDDGDCGYLSTKMAEAGLPNNLVSDLIGSDS